MIASSTISLPGVGGALLLLWAVGTMVTGFLFGVGFHLAHRMQLGRTDGTPSRWARPPEVQFMYLTEEGWKRGGAPPGAERPPKATWHWRRQRPPPEA